MTFFKASRESHTMKKHRPKKIVIVGDAATGKTTFAQKIAKQTGIELYGCDDLQYIVKFSHKRPEQDIQAQAAQIATFERYIIEGTSRRILHRFLADADVIYFFKSTSLLRQYWYFLKRADPNQTCWSRITFCKYLFCKYFNVGNVRKLKYEAFLANYMDKVITFTHFLEAKCC